MKISVNVITKQNLYLLFFSIILLLFVLMFSFLILIPEGKNYREQRGILNKKAIELRRYEEFTDKTLQMLKELQSENAHIITSFDNTFSPTRFQKQFRSYFTSLELSKQVTLDDEIEFNVYEVNTTSSIISPQSFYNFLDAINKADWIIGVNFPIEFKRDQGLISSSFTIRVYKSKKESQE